MASSSSSTFLRMSAWAVRLLLWFVMSCWVAKTREGSRRQEICDTSETTMGMVMCFSTVSTEAAGMKSAVS